MSKNRHFYNSLKIVIFYLQMDNKIKNLCQNMYTSDFLSHRYKSNK